MMNRNFKSEEVISYFIVTSIFMDNYHNEGIITNSFSYKIVNNNYSKILYILYLIIIVNIILLSYFLFNFLNQMQNIIIKNNNFSINRISQIDNNFFTGYYDFCPFDDQNKLIICHKLNNIFEDPSFKNYIEVGFIDIKLKSFKSISETYARNLIWC